MSRYLGPKNKLARHLGVDLGLKTTPAKLQRRLGIPPGAHGRKGRRSKLSGYGLQLQEKQKVKWMYGVSERQLRRYFSLAAKTKHSTGEVLLQLLERRLDNALYRLHFAPTRAAARQLVSHGHIRVNQISQKTPSHLIAPGDVIALSDKIIKSAPVKAMLEVKKPDLPAWLKRQATAGKVDRLPDRKDVDADINEQLIVEFYSR